MEENLVQMIEGKRGKKNRVDWKGRRGTALSLVFAEVEHDLSGGISGVDTAFIPDGAIVLHISARITAAVVTTGAPAAIMVGDGTVNYFEMAVSSNAIALGATFTSKDAAGTSPRTTVKPYQADTDLAYAFRAGSTPTVTAGKVRIVMTYLIQDAPKG